MESLSKRIWPLLERKKSPFLELYVASSSLEAHDYWGRDGFANKIRLLLKTQAFGEGKDADRHAVVLKAQIMPVFSFIRDVANCSPKYIYQFKLPPVTHESSYQMSSPSFGKFRLSFSKFLEYRMLHCCSTFLCSTYHITNMV